MSVVKSMEKNKTKMEDREYVVVGILKGMVRAPPPQPPAQMRGDIWMKT